MASQSYRYCPICKLAWNLRISLYNGGIDSKYYEAFPDSVRKPEVDLGIKFTTPADWFHSPIPYILIIKSYCLDVPLAGAQFGLMTESLLSEQCSFYDESDIDWEFAKGPFYKDKRAVMDLVNDADNGEIKDVWGCSLKLVETIPVPNNFIIQATLKTLLPSLPGAVITRNYRQLEYVGPREACVSIYVILLSIQKFAAANGSNGTVDLGRLKGCLNGGFVTITRRNVKHRSLLDTAEARLAKKKHIQSAIKAYNLGLDEDTDVCCCATSLHFEGGIKYGDLDLLKRIGHQPSQKDIESVADFAKWPLVHKIVNFQSSIEFKRVSKEMMVALKKAEKEILDRVESKPSTWNSPKTINNRDRLKFYSIED